MDGWICTLDEVSIQRESMRIRDVQSGDGNVLCE